MAAVTTFLERNDLYEKVKPYQWDGPDGQSFPKSNFVMKNMELNLTDIRTVPEFKPTIEDNGFCYLQQESKELANMTGAEDCMPYMHEMAEFLKDRFGTEEVFPINANFRDSRSVGKHTGQLPFAHLGKIGTIKLVAQLMLHNTVASSWSRISTFLTEDERHRVLSGQSRARVLNIWRPRFNPAEDVPLAICDPRTNIDLNDVVPVDRLNFDAVKEVAYFTWNPAHRWYWMSNQTPDEIVIMTQYDTHPPGFFNIIPHAAFRNGAARAGCPPRQSVEARFIMLEPAPYKRDIPVSEKPYTEEGKIQPWKEWVTPPEPMPAPAPTADNRPMYF